MAVAVGLNINTLTIIDFFSTNEAARSIVVRQAESGNSGTTISYNDAKQELDKLGLPIGWNKGWGAPRADTVFGAGRPWNEPWNDLFAPFLGWLMTAFAATLGAPFWFDVLNKIMVIRSTVKPHEKSREEGSEDRQVAGVKTEAEGSAGTPPSAGLKTGSPPTDGFVPEWEKYPGPADPESEIDGCDAIEVATSDEDLPVAEGGVA